MWGNVQGWVISAVLVALVSGWLFFVANASRQTPPTAFSVNPRNFEPLRLPEPPDASMPPPTSSENAGALYKQAIALVLADRPTYEDFARIGKLDSPAASDLPAVDLIVQAASAKRGEIFVDQPKVLINYDRAKPPLEALQVLGRICIDRFGLLSARAGNKEEAMKYYGAGMALGTQLASERVNYDELALGLELMSKASAGMASIAPADLAAALKEFDQKRMTYARDRMDPILRITRTIDPKIIGTHTGDVFEIAQRSSARVWRVEAIMQLGRVRHLAGAGGTRANQANAMKLFRELAEKDESPIIRAAAEAARDVTREQHLMQ